MKRETLKTVGTCLVLASGLGCSTAQPSSLATQIAPGYRAVTLPVPSDELGAICAGDHVDVVVTFPAGSQFADRKAQTLFQYVKVLKVARHGASAGKGNVDLQLNPNEAQYAVLAGDDAKIHLVVRPKDDKAEHPMEVIEMRKLFR